LDENRGFVLEADQKQVMIPERELSQFCHLPP
jgi:hypothetical protein